MAMFRQISFKCVNLIQFSAILVQLQGRVAFKRPPFCVILLYIGYLGLKKVTDDMKTHKNPSLRNQGPVATTKSSALSPRPYSPPQFKKFNAPVKDKPPVFELQMKKWVVVSFTLVSPDDIYVLEPQSTGALLSSHKQPQHSHKSQS